MKISVFLSRFPYPLTKGDKLRAYHQIVELSKHHEIYLFCLNCERISENDITHLRPYCKDIEIFDLKKPLQILKILFSFFSSVPPLKRLAKLVLAVPEIAEPLEF